AGARRLIRGEEESACLRWHLPDAWAFVRRPTARRHRHLVPASILPRSRARSRGRALPAASRQSLLTGLFLLLQNRPPPAFSFPQLSNSLRSTRSVSSIRAS